MTLNQIAMKSYEKSLIEPNTTNIVKSDDLKNQMGISMVAVILAIVLCIFTNAYASGISIISIFVLLSILFTALLFKKTLISSYYYMR